MLDVDAPPRMVGELASDSETKGAAMRSIAVEGVDCQRQSVSVARIHKFSVNLIIRPIFHS